ncbi:MAG: hypothetical protein BGO67_00135 [Alphaproteobacteria bacterium 41-28]|nr:MAG: hypothetical protein BGO67_00135 [Alphaproteobacteria bacterium 41-28]
MFTFNKLFIRTVVTFSFLLKGFTYVHAAHPFEDHYGSDTLHRSVNNLTPAELMSDFVMVSKEPSILNPASEEPLKTVLPLLRQDGEKLRLNPNFVNEAYTYAEMADLTYHLVQGRNELTDKYLERFMNEGWKFTAFSGFSGNDKFDKTKYDAKNLDLAGFVAFNSKKNEAVVAFHGSQDKLDWENNFQSEKIRARELGFNFDGQVHRGFAERYESSKEDMYKIITQIYNGLDEKAKSDFQITFTGHSLAGGIATIGYADASTDLAKKLWGGNYRNTVGNRIRGFAMSPPRAFDEEAVTALTTEAGINNLIIDTNDLDPVSMVGPGRTVTKWLETSSPNGPTGWLLKGAKAAGLLSTSDPQAVAQQYGGYRHLGVKALQSTAESIKTASQFPVDSNIPKKGLIAGTIDNIKAKFAPVHYGSQQLHGLTFDPRLIKPETLEDRINASRMSFWQKLKSTIFS